MWTRSVLAAHMTTATSLHAAASAIKAKAESLLFHGLCHGLKHRRGMWLDPFLGSPGRSTLTGARDREISLFMKFSQGSGCGCDGE